MVNELKYKFPKKIRIGDVKFKIIYDYNYRGASFSYPCDKERGIIRFGMRDYKANKSVFLNLVIYELKEILHLEQSSRFTNRGNDSYEFHYDHGKHTDLCCRLSTLLHKFIK